MKSARWLLLSLALMGAILSACGQKGELTLPDDGAPQDQAEEEKQ